LLVSSLVITTGLRARMFLAVRIVLAAVNLTRCCCWLHRASSGVRCAQAPGAPSPPGGPAVPVCGTRSGRGARAGYAMESVSGNIDPLLSG
jgi:hypothetical protein